MTVAVRELRPATRPRVLAILPHYGSRGATAVAVRSLVESGYPELEVVVIDNSGNLAAAGWPETVRVVVPGTNIGYCAAVNLGLARARETGQNLVLFVNNDTEVGAGVIEGLVDALHADETVAGVGPLLTMDGGTRIWAAGSYLRFGPNEVRQRGLGQAVGRAPAYPEEVDFIPGALALYHRRDLEAVGGLEEEYFMYLEDVDLGVRLRRRGKRLLYLPWVRAHHGGSISSGGGVTPLRKFLNGVNTPRLLRRCGSLDLWLSFLLFDILGLLPSLVLHFGNLDRLRAQLAKGRGILLGLRGYVAGPGDVERYASRR